VYRCCRVEQVLELAHIALNKNTVPGDKSAMVPGGIRMGSPALTSRGFIESDFEQVSEFVHRGVEIAQACKSKTGVALTIMLAIQSCCRSRFLLRGHWGLTLPRRKRAASPSRHVDSSLRWRCTRGEMALFMLPWP
jgi:hypothetical protein